ncbi:MULTISPECIES: ABC transporter ATP-binding protein [unclassified Schlesneria]|uniref:ABC transporter ATP-binding protein n=1 Tax=Schlesneria TaxID=656899 RepID=UPI002F202AB3
MIEVQAVSKMHRRGRLEVPALREITCQIPKGSFTFILGPSGSGKSTLLYLLGALDEPTTGTITVHGKSLQSMTASERDEFRRKDAGFIFQNFNLLANLTAVENVLVPFLPTGVSRELRNKAAELLDRLGLGDRREHRPNQLSGGEQQRVAIARALLKRPKLVLADEPTGELDTANSLAILQDLRALCQEQQSTVVVVTHEHEYIREDDHVIRIRDGRVANQP